MGSFTVTVASNSILLNEKRQGEASFTVSNAGGRALRGRARIVPADATTAGWLKLQGDAERDFAIAGTQQYTVQITVPPTAKEGNYTFKLDMIGVDNPDDDLSEGPVVTFEVPKPVVVKKPFPWWIVAVAAVIVLVVAAGIGGMLFQQNQQSAAATRTAVAQTTQTAIADATATMLAQNAANATATTLAQNATNATATAQAQSIAGATATAQAEVSAAQTAVAQSALKYSGAWVRDTGQSAGITDLSISSSGTAITMQAQSDVQDILVNGNPAQSVCKPNKCSWGQRNVQYDRDPVTVQFDLPSGVSHLLTLTVTPDNRTLGVLDKAFSSNKTFYTVSYTFHRTRPILVNPVINRPGILLP